MVTGDMEEDDGDCHNDDESHRPPLHGIPVKEEIDDSGKTQKKPPTRQAEHNMLCCIYMSHVQAYVSLLVSQVTHAHTHTRNKHSCTVISVQEKLLRAAKARIDRMCAEKVKRKDLQAPSWLVQEWKSGNKTNIARVLQEENFDRVFQ